MLQCKRLMLAMLVLIGACLAGAQAGGGEQDSDPNNPANWQIQQTWVIDTITVKAVYQNGQWIEQTNSWRTSTGHNLIVMVVAAQGAPNGMRHKVQRDCYVTVKAIWIGVGPAPGMVRLKVTGDCWGEYEGAQINTGSASSNNTLLGVGSFTRYFFPDPAFGPNEGGYSYKTGVAYVNMASGPLGGTSLTLQGHAEGLSAYASSDYQCRATASFQVVAGW